VKVSDTLLGLMVLLLAMGMWAGASDIPNPSLQPYGPGFFPKLLAVLLAGCALLLVAQGWRRRGMEPAIALAPWARNPVALLRLVSVPAAVLIYVFLVEDIGFLPVAAGVLLSLFLLGGTAPLRALPLAAGLTLLVHSVFYLGLGVQLPWGVLAPVAW